MKIDDLIKILEHTKKKIGGDKEVVFSYGIGADRREFDFGEKGRDNYCLCVTIMDTHMHVDGWGRFIIPIRRIVRPDATPEMDASYRKSLKEDIGLSDEAVAKCSAKQDRIAQYLKNRDQQEIRLEKGAYSRAESELDAALGK